MNRLFRRCFCALSLVTLAAAPALAQVTSANPFKVDQRWVAPLAAHTSIVDNCQGAQVTFAPIAMDDFLCTKNGPLVRIQWWGTMDNANLPVQRRFFVRIWSDAGTAACRPAQPLWQNCVDATFQVVGTDCTNRRVFRFSANLPQPWFVQTAGTRYWIQISEVDRGNVAGQAPFSPRPGVVDWRWSAHRSIKMCPALQRNANGTFVQPLLDPCDQQPDDLAFRIFSRAITGTIPGTPGLSIALRNTYSFDLYRPGTTELIESLVIEPNADGSFEAYPEAPDGAYDIRIRGGGSTGLLLPAVQLADGEVQDFGELTLPKGDANFDGRVNFTDITEVLANLGSVAP